MPQKACGRGIYQVMAYAFFSKCPKIEDAHFRSIFCFQNQMGKIELITCFFFEMPHFSMLDFFEMPHFSLLILKTENGPKMSIFDFGAFRKKMHMQSRATYIFHILFGAFQVTPRIT